MQRKREDWQDFQPISFRAGILERIDSFFRGIAHRILIRGRRAANQRMEKGRQYLARAADIHKKIARSAADLNDPKNEGKLLRPAWRLQHLRLQIIGNEQARRERARAETYFKHAKHIREDARIRARDVFPKLRQPARASSTKSRVRNVL